MSTSTIFDDDFSSYTPGSDSITGFYDQGFFKGEVVAFSTMTGSSQAPGFYERLGQGYAMSGAGGILSHEEIGGGAASTQIVWAAFGQIGVFGDRAPLAIVNNADLSSGTGSSVGPSTPLAGVLINPDLTMSLYISSTLGGSLFGGVGILDTTEQQVYSPFIWQYYQVNYTFFSVIVGTLGTFVAITGTLGVNGTQVAVGTGTTTLHPSSLYTGASTCNQWQFFSAGGGIMADITGITGAPLPGFGVFPHPVTPRHSLYTQSTVELIKYPTPNVRHGRVTQGSVELVKLPPSTARHAHITQGVVEIILRRSPGGWICYEA